MGKKGTQYSSVSRWRAQPPLPPFVPLEERVMPLTDKYVDDGRLTASRKAQIVNSSRAATSSSN
jgi:hypothetical protein